VLSRICRVRLEALRLTVRRFPEQRVMDARPSGNCWSESMELALTRMARWNSHPPFASRPSLLPRPWRPRGDSYLPLRRGPPREKSLPSRPRRRRLLRRRQRRDSCHSRGMQVQPARHPRETPLGKMLNRRCGAQLKPALLREISASRGAHSIVMHKFHADAEIVRRQRNCSSPAVQG
jgi:hypothetical protein